MIVSSQPLLYVILDPRALLQGADILDVTHQACAGGARVIQLRDKSGTSGTARSARELVALARAMRRVCHEHGARFVVNDRLDIALVSGADGLHVGPDDLSVEDVRRVAPSLWLGASTRDPDDAEALIRQGADYLGVGALFDARPSKPNASPPLGTRAVEEVCAVVDAPVFGIGGITAQTARAVIDAGARGVAVIRAVTGHPDPELAARQLVELMHGSDS